MSEAFPALAAGVGEEQDPLTLLYGYLPLDGSEAMQGDLDMGGNDIRRPGKIRSDPLTEPNWAQCLYFDGANATRIDMPDDADSGPTSDFTFAILIDPDDWTPASDQTWACKFNTSGSQKSFLFRIKAAGTLQVGWSTNGAAESSATSSVATGFSPGTKKWILFTLRASDGANKFATASVTSATDWSPGTFTQLGSTGFAGATSVFNSTARLMLGGYNDGSAEPPAGKAYGLLLRNAFDTTLGTAIWTSPQIKLMIGQTTPTGLVGWPLGDISSTDDSSSVKTWTIRGTVQPYMTIESQLASGVGFTIAGVTGRSSFGNFAIGTWSDAASGGTTINAASWATVLTGTITLPFTDEFFILFVSFGAETESLGAHTVHWRVGVDAGPGYQYSVNTGAPSITPLGGARLGISGVAGDAAWRGSDLWMIPLQATSATITLVMQGYIASGSLVPRHTMRAWLVRGW